ncbi:MAG: YcfL family protein [Rhodocyclales bacterium]|nr:YcfL family protein [Rhodocyclales bacterium]
MKLRNFLLPLVLAAMAGTAMAQSGVPTGTPAAVAAKIQLRGDANDIVIPEIRIVRRNDVMVVQADMKNTTDSNRTVFYRFRWLDSSGSQVGDGESWKQMTVLGHQIQTVKSVALHSSAVDFRIEMNVETQ